MRGGFANYTDNDLPWLSVSPLFLEMKVSYLQKVPKLDFSSDGNLLKWSLGTVVSPCCRASDSNCLHASPLSSFVMNRSEARGSLLTCLLCGHAYMLYMAYVAHTIRLLELFLR